MRVTRFVRSCAAATLCLGIAISIAMPRTTATAGRATGTADANAAVWHRLPERLSQTGLYSDPQTLTVDADNRPYVPQYPLWSDGAVKRRWVRLPAGAAIDVSNVDAWTFPVGTRFWKEFAFAGRRIETRMLVKVRDDRWDFASYVWNAEQTDAVLAPPAGAPDVAEIAPGKRHSIPSVDECRACHDSNRTEVLGFTALQLSDDRDPLAPHAEPVPVDALTLRSLAAEGRLTPVRPELVATPPRIVATSPRERAVLGYLSTNCGACHNAQSTLAPLGLLFRQPAYDGGIGVVAHALQQRTKWDRPGALPETTHVIEASAIETSALLVRMRSRRPLSQMPPLGTVVPDREAVDLVTAWIDQDVRPRLTESSTGR